MVQLRFGLTLPQRGVFFGVTSYSELFELASVAERSPVFDAIWVGDSLTAKPRPEAIGLLSALATRTRSLKLGVGCMASFPLRDPVLFAYQWATLDALSGGRTQLAACTGLAAGAGSAPEAAIYGVPPRERPARMEENMEICRLLWSGDERSYRGRFTSFERVSIQPRPAQDPCPIWIAANPAPGRFFERALRRVATRADGWMTVQRFPGMLASCWSRLRELLSEQGRDPEQFPTAAYHNFNIGADRKKCLEETQRFLDAYYGPVFEPQMVEAWTAAGTPEQCVEQLNGLARDGARHIALRATSWNQREQLDLLLEHVLPQLTQ